MQIDFRLGYTLGYVTFERERKIEGRDREIERHRNKETERERF
jgi:hypothetical protein